MLNVVTFLWRGDRWSGDDHGEKYVDTLYRMVRRNLSTPFKFICFCDRDLSVHPKIEQRLFSKKDSLSWKGVLPRMYMYSPQAELYGQVLALDLDVVIVGPLDDIAGYRGDFCVRSKFKPGEEYKADGDIIGFNADKCRGIWYKFMKDPIAVENFTGGRERYFYRKAVVREDRWQRLFPGQIVSYKRHVRRRGKPPKKAVIVSCHGKPRPHQINESWAKENWR